MLREVPKPLRRDFPALGNTAQASGLALARGNQKGAKGALRVVVRAWLWAWTGLGSNPLSLPVAG